MAEMTDSIFTAQSLGGEYLELQLSFDKNIPTAVTGAVSSAAKGLFAALSNRPILYIAPTFQNAQEVYAQIINITDKKCVLLPPKDDCLIYRQAFSKESLYRRITALFKMQQGAQIIVTDIDGALLRCPKKIDFIELSKGGEYAPEALCQRLLELGYRCEFAAEAKGTFSLRGDILDIYPINCDNAVRLDFFGDTLENIIVLNTDGERAQRLENIEIIAAVDFPKFKNTQEILQSFEQELDRFDKDAKLKAENIYLDIKRNLTENPTFYGLSFAAPLSRGYVSLAEIIGKDFAVVLDEPKLISDKAEQILLENKNRHLELLKEGLNFSFSLDHYMQKAQFFERLKDFAVHAFQNFNALSDIFKPLKFLHFNVGTIRRYLYNIEALSADIRAWLKNDYRVYIFTGSDERGQRLADILTENSVKVSFKQLSGAATIIPQPLERGVLLHDSKMAVIGSGDLYYKKQAERRLKRRRNDLFISPEIGDYAVHEQHGIGKITGTKKIETSDGSKDYIALEYAGGDILYVPVENMGALSKYMGEGQPSVGKIGGREFAKAKERAAQSIKKLAIDLKKLYAERLKDNGYKFEPDSTLTEEFAAAFEFEPTVDQLLAYDEISADMESGKVMDRLLCGDVGFGKTEVAFRAVFKAVISGKQCALMCPTTILSQQHYKTALERFENFGVRTAVLNRFKTGAEQRDIIERLKDGQIDFIIGTHRLLGKDIAFKDLGLLILDEEQRFGVEHKEKLKSIKSAVDCLTMTATPIPRTLYMSLAGIRDISMIETPPESRLPIETAVVEESEALIRDAVLRELSRGGQAFILYNKVESIDRFGLKIAQILPEANIVITHGQMQKKRLEENISKFYSGESNLLITTTIIENGIDLPLANTIIIIDSDRLGISQLYQLRGRVGRSHRLAQAYFTFKGDRLLTEDAIKRLSAVMEFTELGSGYKIAARDLEIRGAGNVLGAQQHGHIVKIGYELYSKLLKEEIDGREAKDIEMDIKVSAYIPEDYVEKSSARLDCYKKIAEIKTDKEARSIADEMTAAFGKLPQGTVNLITIALIKVHAAKLGLQKVKIEGKVAELIFADLESLSSSNMLAAINTEKNVTLEAKQFPTVKLSQIDKQNILVITLKFIKYALSL